MRRPTRTRRLSIAAIVSLLAFGAVAGAEVRSFWSLDCWENSNGRWGIAFADGCAIFNHHSEFPASFTPTGFYHIDVRPDAFEIKRAVWGFHAERVAVHLKDGSGTDFYLYIPIWSLLLLLLIIPVCWLIGRPANAPAFPVITDPK